MKDNLDKVITDSEKGEVKKKNKHMAKKKAWLKSLYAHLAPTQAVCPGFGIAVSYTRSLVLPRFFSY